MPISSIPLPGDEEPPDASSQVAWLRSMGDREALFQLMDGDRRSMQGLQAAEALAQLGDVRGLDQLIAMLNDSRSGLRMEAAEILQSLGHPRGLRAVRELQTETQSSPRAAEREQLYEDLSAATTDELMAIWHENNRAEWTDVEFEVIETILLERLGSLPRRAVDSGGAPEVDEEVDPRIRQLWMEGDTESLRRIMVQDSDGSLQRDAAEALADLGDERALDALIEMLDDGDEERGDVAAGILDWLDLPRGNSALREHGYELDTGAAGSDEMHRPPVAGSTRSVSEGSRIESEPRESWMSRTPGMPGESGAAHGPDHGAPPRAPFGTIATGAVGGLLGFLVVCVGLDLLGLRPLPNAVREWLTPSLVYSIIESLAVGALSGGIGRRVARGMASRDGDDVDEQDARLVLGALISGAAAAVVLGILRFVFGS